MIFSRNIVTIFFLLTYIDNMMLDDTLTKCIRLIYSNFDFGDDKPLNSRFEFPRRAFYNKVIEDFTNDVAKNYFGYLCDALIHKDSMQLPRKFCENKTKKLNEYRRSNEYRICEEQLCTTFLNSDDKTRVLKDVFWRLKESFFLNYGSKNYRHEYFTHLGSKVKYPSTINQKNPLTPKEFCAESIRSSGSSLILNQGVITCAEHIFNDFGLTDTLKQSKSRKYLPVIAFISFVENDLQSPDTKDYFNHIYNLIKAKDGTENPRKYCETVTKEFQEERKCVGHLITLFMDSDTTTVLRDAFRNFKESNFTGEQHDDYRFKYFHYLSGNYEFYKTDVRKKLPLTPMEFCEMDRTEVLNIRMPNESGSMSLREEGSSSSNTFKKVFRIEDLL